jgi:hypothetical protein
MATTNSITTTYAGEFAGKYISAALLSGSTLANNEITIMPNVKFKEVVQNVASGNLLSSASCDFTPSSSVTLTERIIEPQELQVNLELCKSNYLSTWQAMEMGFSAYHEFPASFADFLIAHVAEKVAEEIEKNIWQGDTTGSEPTNHFDGFAKLIEAASGVNDVDSTSVTAANVVDELGKIVDALPSATYSKSDLKVYVSSNIARAYQRALGGFAAIGTASNTVVGPSYQDQSFVGRKPMNFDGVDLVMCPGLADNTAVASPASNLMFGTGLLSDQNEVRVIDMAEYNGSQNIRVIMRMTAGVQFGIAEDIVLYNPA